MPDVNLNWNEENGCVCGCCEGCSKEEFIEQVKKDAENLRIELPGELKVKKETMISAEKTIFGDTIQPLSGLGVVIEDYWVLEID